METDEKNDLIAHMKDFGLHMIGKGLYNAHVAEMLWPYNHAMAIVHIAHGTEIIIKARIAEYDFLSIFSNVSKRTDIDKTNYEEVMDVFEEQTIGYSKLPERLFAITGYKIPDIELFKEFGKLRNQIIHLAVPDEELSDRAMLFGFGLIEKMVNDWWDVTLLKYASRYDSEFVFYIFEMLDRLKIEIAYTAEGYEIIKKRN